MAWSSLSRQLALRLGLGGLIIAAILGAATFAYEMERIDDTFVEEAVAEAQALSPQLPPNLDVAGAAAIRQHLRNFLDQRKGGRGENFVGAEIYNRDKNSVAEVVMTQDDALESAIDRSNHVFPTDGESWYAKHIVGGEVYLLVLTGLSAEDGSTKGYFEGIYHVSRARLTGISRLALRSVVLVILSVLAASALLHPIITRLHRSLVHRSLDLLHSNLGAIEMLGSAIAKRDSDTNSHNYRVSLYALHLAEAEGLGHSTIRSLLKGAFLHDVGKLAIPDAILLKPGKLDDEEFAVMKTHVHHGLDLITQFRWLRDAADVVGCHHEKFDGSGYDHGLAGEQIPITARIFAIADVFDALTSKRPYKLPFPVPQATAIMAAGRGGHFDPRLLDLFFTLADDLHALYGGREDDGLKYELRHRTLHYFREVLEK